MGKVELSMQEPSIRDIATPVRSIFDPEFGKKTRNCLLPACHVIRGNEVPDLGSKLNKIRVRRMDYDSYTHNGVMISQQNVGIRERRTCWNDSAGEFWAQILRHCIFSNK